MAWGSAECKFESAFAVNRVVGCVGLVSAIGIVAVTFCVFDFASSSIGSSC